MPEKLGTESPAASPCIQGKSIEKHRKPINIKGFAMVRSTQSTICDDQLSLQPRSQPHHSCQLLDLYRWSSRPVEDSPVLQGPGSWSFGEIQRQLTTQKAQLSRRSTRGITSGSLSTNSPTLVRLTLQYFAIRCCFSVYSTERSQHPASFFRSGSENRSAQDPVINHHVPYP